MGLNSGPSNFRLVVHYTGILARISGDPFSVETRIMALREAINSCDTLKIELRDELKKLETTKL